MALTKASFEMVEERKVCYPSYFTARLPAAEALEEFDNVVRVQSQKVIETNKSEKLPYGDDEKQYLEVFYPSITQKSTGVVVFFHGGYWHEGSTDLYACLSKPITKAGKICILVSRALCPSVRIHNIIEQDRKALQCIMQTFRDASDVTLFGHSSGGHECAMLMSTAWSKINPDLDVYLKAKLKKVVCVCAVLEVTHLLDTLVDEDLHMSWEEALSCSPITHVKEVAENMRNYECNLHFITVENESPSILKWTRIYERELKNFGVKFNSTFLKDKDHFNIFYNMDNNNCMMEVVLGGDMQKN